MSHKTYKKPVLLITLCTGIALSAQWASSEIPTSAPNIEIDSQNPFEKTPNKNTPAGEAGHTLSSKSVFTVPYHFPGAFSLWANGGKTSLATRKLSQNLKEGDNFAVQIDTNWVQAGKSVGFTLADQNGKARLLFSFVGGENNYRVEDSSGSRLSKAEYTPEGTDIIVELTKYNGYRISCGTSLITGTLMEGEPINTFIAFNESSGTGAEHEFHIGTLRVERNGQIIAADSPSDKNYSEKWASGSQGGFGFEPWLLSVYPDNATQTKTIAENPTENNRLPASEKEPKLELEFTNPEQEIKPTVGATDTKVTQSQEVDLLVEGLEISTPAKPTPTPSEETFNFDLFTEETKDQKAKTAAEPAPQPTESNTPSTPPTSLALEPEETNVEQKITLTTPQEEKKEKKKTEGLKKEEPKVKEAVAQTSPNPQPTEETKTSVAPEPETPTALANTNPEETPQPENTTENLDENLELLLQKLREDALKKEIARSSLIPNQTQDEINFDDVPLGSALRLLAEQAGFNFIEPNLPNPDEKISLRFQKMTPLEAFMKIAKARGFAVVTENGFTTLKRPDIQTPEFLLVKKYRLKHTQAKWVIQSVANLLGIQLSNPAEVIASFPPPDEEATLYGAEGSSGGGTNSSGGSSSQNIGLPSSPRWTSSLPYDEPAYTGADKTNPQGTYLFVDRAANAIVVRASMDDQKMISQYLESVDIAEPQILIETRVIEVTLTDRLLYGIDWAQALGQGIKIKGSAVDIDLKNFSKVLAGGGQVWSLFLSIPETEITIRAFQEFGNGSVVNMPRTMTRSNVPVSISSTITDATPAYQLSTGTGGAGAVSTPSGFNTFTTGMTIDVVPQILDNGLIDLNINPSVANKVAEQRIPATSTTPEQVIPIISSRSLTTSAIVPSGMTIMLGGITESREGENNTGIPILSKMPLLGKTIFGNSSKGQERKTLIVFVTPKIIYPDQYEKVYAHEEEWRAMVNGNRNNWNTETAPLPTDKPIRAAIPLEPKLLKK